VPFPHEFFTEQPSVLLTLLLPDRDTVKVMARYSSFLGHRVEVQYRASDTLVPASGVMVADSGKSIFLEQTCEQRGLHHHFRWEIPYQYLIRIACTPGSLGTPEKGESATSEPAETMADAPQPSAEESAATDPVASNVVGFISRDAVEDKATRASGAAAGAGRVGSMLPLGNRSHTA
jgi:hypothetical protein